jgi:hypothetical protein
MNRKGLLVLPAMAVLAAAFVIISFLVLVSRGHPGLIRSKLKLGALLLGFVGFFGSGCGPTHVTCYAPIPGESLSLMIEDVDDWGLVFDLAQGHRLVAYVSFREHDAFAFRLLNEDEIEDQRGEILPSDGAYDSSSEECYLELDENLPAGRYWLELYIGHPVDIGNAAHIGRYRLSLIWSEG